MNDIQVKLLEMLKYIHSVCTDLNIRYYALGGTLLGAVRHKGFIPWDDDVDIGLPRKDYDKLINYLQTACVEQYAIECCGIHNKTYTHPYAKLYDTTTTIIENTIPQKAVGLSVDIFPLDGIGNSKDDSLKNYMPIKKYLNFLTTRLLPIEKKRAIYKNAILIISRILTAPIPVSHIINHIDKLERKRDYDKYDYIGNLAGAWREKEIMPKKILGTPMLYDFESIKIYGPEDFNGYLSSLYGDWNKLPPEEKRVSHHDYIFLDLNSSYLNYKQ